MSPFQQNVTTPNRSSSSTSNHGNKGSSPRPLGKPASDLSMYYDKNFFFPPTASPRSRNYGNRMMRGETGGKWGQQRCRPATTIPRITELNKYDNNSPVDRRSWPQIGGIKDGWQHGASQSNSTSYRERVSSQLSTHTVSDQRQKVGICKHDSGRPQTHNIASLPSFKTQQKKSQPRREQPPCRSHSEQAMYKLPTVSKITKSAHQPAGVLQFASNGLSVRHSTYRSLANNPNLKVEAKHGKVKISRRRPKSLPSKFQDMQQLKSPREVTVTLTGWQGRSRSPTFTTLAQAKEHLDAALSRKLWEIRRHVDGQRARENSAVFSEVSASSSYPDIAHPEHWYERMLREHSDEDLAAIETLCIANHDDEQPDSLEPINVEKGKPPVDFRFDKNYLKAHINDWNVLALMQEEERKRTEKEVRESKRNAGHKIRTAKTMKPIKTVEKPKALRKTRSVALPKPEPVKEEPVVEHELPVDELPNLDQTQDIQLNTTNDDSNVTIPTDHLVAKYLAYREPAKTEEKSIGDEPNNDKEPVDETKEEPVAEKKLTEKEKFLLMRQRMEERKAEKHKKKEQFGDYVRLGMNVKKGAKNFLGNLMSSRLEKMTTYKSCDDGGESEEDNDDTSDEDDEN